MSQHRVYELYVDGELLDHVTVSAYYETDELASQQALAYFAEEWPGVHQSKMDVHLRSFTEKTEEGKTVTAPDTTRSF